MSLKELYDKEVVPKLVETFKYKNKFQVPRLEKIVLNMGLGAAIQNIKMLDSAKESLKRFPARHRSLRAPKSPYLHSRFGKECRSDAW